MNDIPDDIEHEGHYGNQQVVVQNLPQPRDDPRGAIAVAVMRDEGKIMAKIKAAAARAGDDFYYRWSVKNKDGSTGWVEGPSIKAANVVARYFGNNFTGVRTEDKGPHWLMTARFYDYETGYVLERQFQQRKTQNLGKKMDADRQLDIVFQIGQSKAIRNVVNNALTEFTTFAFEEARKAIVDRVGKALPEYRQRVKTRLAELEVEFIRVERRYGRKLDEMLASDIAGVVAEIQAINDGMASAEDTWPREAPPAERPTMEQQTGQTATNGNGAPADPKPEPKKEPPKEVKKDPPKAADPPAQKKAAAPPPPDPYELYLDRMMGEFRNEAAPSDKAVVSRTFMDSIDGWLEHKAVTPERADALKARWKDLTGEKPAAKKAETKKAEPVGESLPDTKADPTDREADYKAWKKEMFAAIDGCKTIPDVDALQDVQLANFADADKASFVAACNAHVAALARGKK